MKKMLTALSLLLLAGCFYEVRDRRAMAPAAPPLTRGEVEKMAAAGVSDAVILETVDHRGAKVLSADDIVALKTAGASDEVISRMQSNVRKEPEIVYVESPVYYHYYYGPYWYPWWGFSYSYWGRRGGGGVRVGW
jgi:hypothetical protein